MPRPRGRRPKNPEQQPQEEIQETTVEAPAEETVTLPGEQVEAPSWQAVQITAEEAALVAAAQERPATPLAPNVTQPPQSPTPLRILQEPTVTGPVSQGSAWASADLRLPDAVQQLLRQKQIHAETFAPALPSSIDVGDESDLAREEFRSSSAKCYILVSEGIPQRQHPDFPGQTIPGTPTIAVDFARTPDDEKYGHYITPDFGELTNRFMEYFMARDPQNAREKARATAAYWIRRIKAKIRNHKYFRNGMIKCVDEDVAESKEATLRTAAKLIQDAGGDPNAVLAQLPKVTGKQPEPAIRRGGVTPREVERDAINERLERIEAGLAALAEK